MAWSSTTQSAKETASIFSSGWNDNPFGVTIATTSSLGNLYGVGDTLSSSLSTSLNYLTQAGVDVASAFTDSQQYLDVLDAAGSVSLNFLNNKVQRIKDLWNTKDTITIGALLGEIAPYALNWKEAGSLLTKRMNSFINYLLGTSGDSWLDTLNSLGTQATNSLLSDPSLTSSISNLKMIQAYGNTLNSMASIITGAQEVMKYLEPLIPVSEILVNFATAWINGGTSAALGSTQMAEAVQKTCQKLGILALQCIKKMVYSVKISVPSLLTGALDSLSVKEAVSLRADLPDWIKSIFNDSYYQDTVNSLTWQTSINKALNETLGTVTDWSNFNFENGTTRGNVLKQNFLSSVVKNYMYGSGGAVAKARAAAHMSSSTDIKEYSGNTKKIEDSSVNTDNSNLDNDLDNDLNESPLSDEWSLIQVSGKVYSYL